MTLAHQGVQDVSDVSPLEAAVQAAVADTRQRAAIARALDEVLAATRCAVDDETRARWRAEARAARLEAIRHIGDLVAAFAAHAEANGVHVHAAKDAAEARAIVLGIARRRGAHLVAKSKSMATEEIRLNDAFAEAGIQVVETDLGEYVVQLAGEAPAHIVSPCIHKDRPAIAELFSREAGEPLASDTATLASFARRHLRDVFRRADMGVTGGNFLVAESGTVVLVSNEGNARMVSTIPPCHVAVVGIDKVVATWRDLGRILRVLALHSTGQKTTVYVSLVNRPRGRGDADGPEEVHVVLLDNGRSRIVGTPYEEVLLCIRCGACLDVCPVFRQTAGHAYLSPYSGPIGAVFTPLIAGIRQRPDLPFLSTLCGACYEACPVGIRLHEHLLRLRRDAVQAGRAWPGDRTLLRLLRFAFGGPHRYRLAARALSRLTARLPRWLPPPVAAWAQVRSLPRAHAVARGEGDDPRP